MARIAPSTSAVINSSYPRVRNNIITLPISGHVQKTSTVLLGQTTRKATQINLINGQLSLHPFSDTWYSQSSLPSVLLNEDNQYKNWKDTIGKFTTDMTIIIQNSKKNPNIKFTFFDAFPTSISGLEMSVITGEVSPIVCNLGIRYESFEIESIE